MLRKIIYSILVIALFSQNAFAEDNYLSKVFTAEKQSKITPKQALKRLKDGNQRFLDNKLIKRNYIKQAKKSSYGQYPWAVVLNCMDSRSVPEFIFDQGIADLFTLRVAGNVLNEDILGSLEFATKAAGAPLIVVLGHTSCGAVEGACMHVKLGALDNVLEKIAPVIPDSQKEVGSKNCEDQKLINNIAANNAILVARQIREKSPIISKLIAEKKLGVVAGMHDLKSGKVTFFEESRLIPEE